MTLREEVRSRQFWRSMLAEILASLVFVSAVLGSSLPGSEGPSLGPIYPALAAGMATVGLGHCFGEISGAQVNPAVTLALLATRRLDVLRAVVYVVAQCLGAILGAGIFYLVLPLKFTAEIYVNKVPMEVNAGQALGAEMLATFQLAFTVFSVEDQRRREGSEPGNIAIGFSVSAGIFIAGKISGGCLNPARSLGPAIIAGYWEHHWDNLSKRLREAGEIPACRWSVLDADGLRALRFFTGTRSLYSGITVFWIGPVLGAVLAGVSHEFFFAPSASRQKLVACLTCKDIEIVETASVSRSSLSTVTQTAMRAKQTNKLEHN